MSRTYSLYLDAIRFLAAMLVMCTHVDLIGVRLGPLAHFGHDAVIVFFVLSGYVIAYTVDRRDHDVKSYAVSRLARLWSVVLPAIVLTVALNAIGAAYAPAQYEPQLGGDAAFNIGASALFLNQIWYLDVAPPVNTPFWSLGFEVMYYAFYACLVFLRGRARIVAAVLALLVMGPKIAVLLPVWLLGVALYRRRFAAKDALGGALLLGSLAFYALYREYDVSGPLSEAVLRFAPLGHFAMAKYFVSDYVVALLVAANLAGFRMIEHRFAPLFAHAARPIRFLAGFTFSIYLFHFPVLVFLGAMLPQTGLARFGIAFAVILLVGSVTERKKDVFRRALLWLTGRAAAPRSAAGAARV
ncbi:MAG TPA: acyltransferase [Stellaceae bacterium]|nr:acyltransferase [Stellaceae bacterium]